MKSFLIKYKVNNTFSQRTIQLHGGTESEAIAKLKQQNSVDKDANVIVLEIKEG